MKQTLFYIRHADGVMVGPYAEAKLTRMRQEGRLCPGDSISTDKVHWETIPEPQTAKSSAVDVVMPASFLSRPGQPEFEEAMGEIHDAQQEQSSVSDRMLETEYSPEWEKWIAVAWSVWKGPWVCDKLLSCATALRWTAFIYSILVLFLSWGVSVPSVLIGSRAWLTLLCFGLGSWVLVLLNSWGGICFSCWFGGYEYKGNDASSICDMTELLRSSTFVGTAVLLHRLPARNGLGIGLFSGIILLLFIWNAVCQYKTLSWYRSKRQVDRRGLYWFLMVSNVYQLSYVFFMIYYFGGYR